jgi:hypothetical protein
VKWVCAGGQALTATLRLQTRASTIQRQDCTAVKDKPAPTVQLLARKPAQHGDCSAHHTLRPDGIDHLLSNAQPRA